MNEYKDLANSLNKDKDYIPRARRIFNNLSSIESILDTGVTFNSMATILTNNGFEIDFIQLKNSVYQARKKKKKQIGKMEEAAPLSNQKTITPTATINQSVIEKAAIINQDEPPKDENKTKRKLTPQEEVAEERKRLKDFSQAKKTNS